jgi:hypothetical protein
MNRIDLSPIDVNDRHKPLGSRAVAQKQRDTHVPYICAYSILQTLENLSSDSEREKTIAKNRISILKSGQSGVLFRENLHTRVDVGVYIGLRAR